MTFLNATLIFAVAAVAVPVVLHLIARREPKRVLFPSIQFLTKRVESNRSQLQIRRWWLLALRMAALAALAIALARPAIHQSLSLTWLTIGLIASVGIVLLVLATIALSRGQSKGFTYGLAGVALTTLIASLLWGGYTYASGHKPPIDNAAPAAIAIVLDNSPTSAWKTPDDDRMVRTKEVARWMTTRLPATSRIAIVDRSATPVAFSLDLASAISKIDQLQPAEVTQPIAARIDAAIRLVRTSELENRQILVITDLTKPTWDKSLADIQMPSLLTEEPEVALTLFDLGEFSAANRSLSPPRLSDATPPRGVPVPISTTLELNKFDAEPRSIIAELELYEVDPALPVVRDGIVKRPALRSVDRTSVQIAPGGSNELMLTIPPMDVGIHHGLIRLIGEDALAIDDSRRFTVEVLPPSHVLLVGDNVDEANVIAQSITAPFAIDDPNAEYLIERVGFGDLLAVRMSDFDAAILLDPPADVLSEEMLREFVDSGGSIFVCLGATLRADNQPAIEIDGLPTIVRQWRSPPPHTFLTPVQTNHPILAPLSEISGGVPWGDYRVQQYWQVETTDDDHVLMRYAGTKHAALVQRHSVNDGGSAGDWLILTTPLPDLADPAKSWNELFGSDAWPAFLLVRQIAEIITRRGTSSWMPVVGQPQVVRLPRLESEAESRRLQLFPPGNAAPVPIDVDASATEMVVADVARSGTYWVRGAGPGLGFSANLPSNATVIDRIDTAELVDWFGADNFQIATNINEVELAETQSAQSVSLRSPIMLFALAVFLLELILGNRFYRRPRSQAMQSTVVA